MRKHILSVLFILTVLLFTLSACSENEDKFVDGYYTAEMEAFDSHGWKEYITICVSDGEIVTLEYNAKNLSGMIKAWDMDYMRNMGGVTGTYPNQYTRAYGGGLLANQNGNDVDAITGATTSYGTFLQLTDAVLALAQDGSEQIALVKSEE
jgi:major membrane immunogen (membrane-anchored lipoprotein)